ncbi:PREDICTED: uncharacterized protein K02A2.6-like [Acropora digitifera]|uniref:uncharacterized protein K02A2.6-like n=1 Tax=Acropora digitifera TaxID=70779 RepID=UPI00077A85FC|nr:PREDICTED: uncharacterized protein K02A2.6-like [Acropora digitifera]
MHPGSQTSQKRSTETSQICGALSSSQQCHTRRLSPYSIHLKHSGCWLHHTSIIGMRERKVQEVLLGKDDILKLDKAMDIARTKEATVNDMKSLEQQGASARPHDTNIGAVKQNSNHKCGKCGLSHGKKCLAKELPNIDHPNPVLKVKEDTGAQGNILPLRIYNNMFPDSVDENGLPTGTAPSQTKMTAYNGTQISQHGVCSIKCSFDDKETDAMFYVADVEGPAICGLPTCCQLQLVELHCAISRGSSKTSSPVIKDKGDLQILYPDRFDGIGKFEGEYHIVTDPDVPPVVHAPRKCPIHIKDDIKKELDEMVNLGVIKPVTEPTDWVSSVAYSQKSNGQWRVCLDPKDLNRAVKRSHHHTPTLDEITHQFKGSSVFSKLDARHGYCSVVLDEESSHLTTFNSPFGRFRFTRLPFGLCVSQDIFQQKMDFILEKCPGTVGIADNIAVHGTTEEEHDSNLYNLMLVVQEHGLVFNLEKCMIKER